MTENHIIEIPNARYAPASLCGAGFDTTEDTFGSVRVGNETYEYAYWGGDNKMPYDVRDKIEKNSVMSQNKYFNMLTCYGRGLEYMDVTTMDSKKPMPTKDPQIRKFLLRNSMKRFFAEQILDLKYYYFSVAVLILDNQRKNIVKIVHKDACDCRFEKRNDKGKIAHVFFADFKDNDNPQNAEMIPLLDEQDPYGDLAARTGKEDDPLRLFAKDRGSVTKYAVVVRIPTIGDRYYPIPTYAAAFRDGWYDIFQLLTAAKKTKIKNGQNIRYHVEINTLFWEERARSKGITMNTVEFKKMKDDFIEELKKYLSGSENSDKLLWSEFESLMDGKERHYIKVNTVDTSKAGSEYNDDVAEAANVLCYDDNTHPNLAGAVPGKSQMNNSGSDKRELFTMKQALETLPHDMMMAVHYTIIFFNGWEEKVEPVVPMIILTTLDKKSDAKEANMNNKTEEDDNGNKE